MKKILTLTFLIGSLTGTLAQGTLQFGATLTGANEVPSNSSVYVGSGTFTLDGNSLSYSVGMVSPFFFPISAGIFGPATTDQTNSLVFDLGNYLIGAPGDGFPGSLGYIGALTLTSQQINDLESGLWYVNFTSSTYPDGEIRGQILSVPEPSVLALLGLGISSMGVWCRRKRP
jgi:hypothetical protein